METHIEFHMILLGNNIMVYIYHRSLIHMNTEHGYEHVLHHRIILDANGVELKYIKVKQHYVSATLTRFKLKFD